MKLIRSLLLLALTSAALQSHAQLLLWKAEKDGQSVMLLGSVHMGKSAFYPMAQPIDDAYAQAKTIVVEADVTDAGALDTIKSRVVLPASKSLFDMLGDKKSKALINTLKQVGISPLNFDHLKPWFASMLIEDAEMTKLGFDPDNGIDLHYLKKAKADKKQVVALESIKEQFDLFDGLPQDDAIAMLDATVKLAEENRVEQEINDMISAWKSGDAEGMRKLIEKDEDDDPATKRFNKKLFGERNRHMVEKIVKLAGTPSPMVIVGAGHLAGPDNLIEMLRARGFQVTQY